MEKKRSLSAQMRVVTGFPAFPVALSGKSLFLCRYANSLPSKLEMAPATPTPSWLPSRTDVWTRSFSSEKVHDTSSRFFPLLRSIRKEPPPFHRRGTSTHDPFWRPLGSTIRSLTGTFQWGSMPWLYSIASIFDLSSWMVCSNSDIRAVSCLCHCVDLRVRPISDTLIPTRSIASASPRYASRAPALILRAIFSPRSTFPSCRGKHPSSKNRTSRVAQVTVHACRCSCRWRPCP
mmetsp:Transcript_61997/g.149178  ORF Transcript_61997/g.149178 Transcript_61997/m.149178 type:complete len:234 (+) Transcript_61997:584-1285(+)